MIAVALPSVPTRRPPLQTPVAIQGSECCRSLTSRSLCPLARCFACAASLAAWRPHRRARPSLVKRRVSIEEFSKLEFDDGCCYEILPDQVLGSGAQGTVYRGRSATGQTVAIKAIPTWRLILEPGCEEKLASIEKELSTLRTLGTHQNIAGMIATADVRKRDAAGVERPHFKLVAMEAVQGRELAEHVALGGPVCESIARHVFLQVLDGLAHMHSCNIIHRDLKPENMMVTGEVIDLDSQVKLIDFGVAKCLSNGPLKTVVGTPSIMAPEVARAKLGNVNEAQAVFSWSGAQGELLCEEASEFSDEFCPKIDVWSAGVCLYTCLAGKLPFRTEEEIIKSDYGKAPLSHCSAEAKDLLRGMLEKDPTKRLSIDQCLAHPWVPCSETDGCTIDMDEIMAF